MAAVKKNSRKGRKSHRRSIFCFLRGCFGLSNAVSADHGDGKLVKYGSNKSSRGKTVPINDHTVSKTFEITSSSREIHVVEEEEKSSQLLAPPAHQVIRNKTDETILENKSLEEYSGRAVSSIKELDKQNTAQRTWNNLVELSHSISQPLPRQMKEKPAAGGGGGKKGRNGNELIKDGEIDSIVGALIIMVTLIVMLIWGKVCAILCTAVWFYFIPRFRPNIDESYAYIAMKPENIMDLDSREYKKKVVLQGLLDRSHQVLV